MFVKFKNFTFLSTLWYLYLFKTKMYYIFNIHIKYSFAFEPNGLTF